jgi:hypothetical protein
MCISKRDGTLLCARGDVLTHERKCLSVPRNRSADCEPAVPDHPAAAAEQGADERHGEKSARDPRPSQVGDQAAGPFRSRILTIRSLEQSATWEARHLPGSVTSSDEEDSARQGSKTFWPQQDGAERS